MAKMVYFFDIDMKKRRAITLRIERTQVICTFASYSYGHCVCYYFYVNFRGEKNT